MAYRSTPCPSASAEAFLGRRLRTELDLMLPSRDRTNGTRDLKMESQFNRRNGARRPKLRSTTRFFTRIIEARNLLGLPVSSHTVLETQPTLFAVETKCGLGT
ncbi:hypothetical protein RB195_025277 [Necator americanus]|uniref:Uncharacterized protein n=1 Tax=Necator americanus TaxID=51031 RepID=A0ABR1ETR8_NECAM